MQLTKIILFNEKMMIHKRSAIHFLLILLSLLVIVNNCIKTADYVKIDDIDDCYIYHNHTYFYMKHKTNWTDANKACEKEQGHLLIIEEKAENDFIKKIIDYHTWLGLTNVEDEDFWKWIDNTFLMWSDWADGMPTSRTTDNYALYHADKNYFWSDTFKGNELYFICEIDKEINDLKELKEIKNNLLSSLLKYKSENSAAFYKDMKGFYHYDGHTYIYVDTTTDWKTAKTVCKNSGGHLLIIDNEAENDFIKKIIDYHTWLGLTDEETESVWKWINGEPLRINDWVKGQPDNYGKLEHYAHYHIQSEDSNWNDVAYYNNYKFVCEYDFEIRDIEELIKCKTELIKNIDIILEREVK